MDFAVTDGRSASVGQKAGASPRWMASSARRCPILASPPPEQKPSKEPALKKPTGPSGARRICPISPAASQVPAYRRPLRISPAPMPVPKVRKTMFRVPLPAPKRHSARAQALASLQRAAGSPSRAVSISVMGTSTQPGRLGGSRMMPRAESMGLPQLTPTAQTACPCRAADSAMAAAVSSIRATVAAQSRVSKRVFSSICPSLSPRTTAHFVPPISTPR